MRRSKASFLVLTFFLFTTSVTFAQSANRRVTGPERGRPEDREIWKQLVRRVGLTEEQQKALLREAHAFKQDVTPFLQQFHECSRILHELKSNDGDPDRIARVEECIRDAFAAIKRLFEGFVQTVSRILTEEQQPALRQAVEVLLVIFNINLPPL